MVDADVSGRPRPPAVMAGSSDATVQPPKVGPSGGGDADGVMREPSPHRLPLPRFSGTQPMADGGEHAEASDLCQEPPGELVWPNVCFL